jgi:ribose 5-phosphate isomerase B
MTIYIGADHRGFALKEHLKPVLKDAGYEVVDLGAEKLVEDDDFTVHAAAVAKKVAESPANARGIVICGSGFGVDIVANKFKGVRSALAISPEHAYQGRHDDDANILALAADFINQEVAEKTAKTFFGTPFAKEDKYSRRLEEIQKIEFRN